MLSFNGPPLPMMSADQEMIKMNRYCPGTVVYTYTCRYRYWFYKQYCKVRRSWKTINSNRIESISNFVLWIDVNQLYKKNCKARLNDIYSVLWIWKQNPVRSTSFWAGFDLYEIIICINFCMFPYAYVIRVVNSLLTAVLRIRIRDPVPFWPLDPGSGIRNRFFPDPGSQDHIFKTFLTIFLVKSSIILWKLAQNFFFSTWKLK